MAATLLLPLLASLALVQPQAAPRTEAALAGTWEIRFEPPLPGDGTGAPGASVGRFALWETGRGLAGGLRAGERTAWIEATPEGERLALAFAFPDLGDARVDLAPDGDAPPEEGRAGPAWCGTSVEGEGEDATSTRVCAWRTEEKADPALRLDVDLAVEHPLTVDRDGLPAEAAAAIDAAARHELEAQRLVGLSLAFVVDGEVADVRSYGWQDFAHRVPASGRTRYRWASISKTVTAVVALQLAERGQLDLDRDVREYVPEFPEKAWVVTARQLLGHRAGIVHYQHHPVVTVREYDDPDPFRDEILALDVFKASPLCFEPGTDYSYSTHGYALLGAVIRRAGGAPYAEQVAERVARPLGMTTFRPDFHRSEEIPDQTVGYVAVSPEVVIDAGDSNVAWKLAGGGFLSTAGDMARFGAGLASGALLAPESLELMATPSRDASGRSTSYGLGLRVGSLEGYRTIGHGGAQRKTRTQLLLVPELGLGVAILCNTEGARLDELAELSLRALL